MKRTLLVLATCALSFACACGDATDPTRPGETTQAVALFDSGRLIVYVYFDNEGISGKRVEVLERGIVRKTNDAGYAGFVLREGDYTVRVYDINRGGPALLYIDTPVTIRAGEETRIEVFDCLPCV